MPVTKELQLCVAVAILVCKLWQPGADADTVKCEPLTRGSCLD